MEPIKHCSCKQYTNYLWIDRSRTTQLTAYALIAALCIFGAGFFFGKRKALETVTEDLQQQAFSDQLHHSMMLLYGQPEASKPTLMAEGSQATVPLDDQAKPEEVKPLKKEQYYIKTVKPFYVLESAQRCIARLQKKGIQSTLIKRESRQQGTNKKVPWYHIETQAYDTEEDVNKVINIIKAVEPTIRVAKLKK